MSFEEHVRRALDAHYFGTDEDRLDQLGYR